MAGSQATELLRLANTVDIHGSLCGQVFANRMLDTLSRKATITFITDGGNKVLQIAGYGVTLCKVDGALTLPAGSVLQQHVLYRPPHSNNASWDALVVESDQVAYLLQMTVASFSAFVVPQAILTADGAASVTAWSQEKWCVDKVNNGRTFWPPQQRE
jgi:hypothetical protein